MKTQILRLEPHDDPASIRDKLAWKQVGRIMLVLPGKGDAGLCNRLNNRLHLQLIQRKAQKMGAQIALITTHTGLERTAAEIGLPVFPSIKEAHKSRWNNRDYAHSSEALLRSRVTTAHQFISRAAFEKEQLKQHPRLHVLGKRNPEKVTLSSKQIWIAGSSLALLVGAMVMLVLLPQARIVLPVSESIQSPVIQVVADPALTSVDILGRIPIHTVSGVIQRSEVAKSSGTDVFPEHAANGMLELKNLSGEPLTLAAGSHLAVQKKAGDPGLTFYTLANETALPPNTEAGAPVRAAIRAEIPGTSGNLAAGFYFSFEGPSGSRLTAFNPDPIQGGSDVRLPTPTSRDRENLEKKLSAALLEAGGVDLTRSLKMPSSGPVGMLLPDSVKLKKVITKDFVPAAENAPANELSLTMQVEYEGKVIRGEDLSQLASLALAADLPQGFEAAGEPQISTGVLQPDSSGRLKLELRVQRQIKQIVDRPALLQVLRGKSPAAAAQILKTRFHLPSPPEITLSPAWWKFLPLFDYQYSLTEE